MNIWNSRIYLFFLEIFSSFSFSWFWHGMMCQQGAYHAYLYQTSLLTSTHTSLIDPLSLHFRLVMILYILRCFERTFEQGFRSRWNILQYMGMGYHPMCWDRISYQHPRLQAFQMGYLGTSHISSVGMERDASTSCFMKKLGQSSPTGFKTLPSRKVSSMNYREFYIKSILETIGLSYPS